MDGGSHSSPADDLFWGRPGADGVLSGGFLESMSTTLLNSIRKRLAIARDSGLQPKKKDNGPAPPPVPMARIGFSALEISESGVKVSVELFSFFFELAIRVFEALSRRDSRKPIGLL